MIMVSQKIYDRFDVFAAYQGEDSSKPSEFKYNSEAIDANDRFVGYALASQTKNNITEHKINLILSMINQM